MINELFKKMYHKKLNILILYSFNTIIKIIIIEVDGDA